MRHFSKKAFSVLLVALVVMAGLFAQSITEVKHGEYYGKTVILHTNDVHGAIEGYAKLAALRDAYEAKEAEVILIDVGDFSQGTTYVSIGKGANAVAMMNAVGYDYVALGNHEFDYGYAQLVENLSDATFDVLCSNVFDANGNPIYANYAIYKTSKGAEIGIFGIDTPEAQTKVNPALIQGLSFPSREELYPVAQAVVDELKAKGVDLIICAAHLGVDDESVGNRSIDLLANVKGIDFLLDGHSHSVFTEYEGYAMQQTGTKFENIGVVEIDSKTGEILDNYLVPCEGLEEDAEVAAKAAEFIAAVDNVYGVKFAESSVELCGDKDPGNRTQETNLGDLITDSMMWCITSDASALKVPVENVVAITNGGGIRAWIHAGDITMKDINTVLPFGNTVAVVYVTGAELLEALEASTFCTPVSLGGFPQTAGMEIVVDTTKAYDRNAETYPASTYYGPASIQRVTIKSVNGQPFDPAATYAVITNNFCAAGGDTYYAFKAATEQFDTSLPLDEVLMNYITDVLGGVVGDQYAEPAGRMTILTEAAEEDLSFEVSNLEPNIFTTKYGNLYCTAKATTFIDELGYDWGDMVTVRFLDKELVLPVVPTYSYVDTGSPAIIVGKDEAGKPSGYVSFAINMGNFTSFYGIAEKTTNEDKTWFWTANEGVTFPMAIEFELAEKGGYLAEYILHDLTRTNERSDYAALTDEQFANFRRITTTGMGDHLYRTSNPANNEIGRASYADAAIKAAGVTTVMNLADDKALAESRAEFAGSYYSGLNVIYLGLGVDFEDASFKAGLAEGLRFFAENPGVYAVHCTEGKDRAGFTSALLECLMGAEPSEVVADYMVTYYNYYGVEPGTDKYEAIANSNIIKTLKSAFGVPSDYDISAVTAADLQYGAEQYIRSIGLSDAEIEALKANLK